MSLACVVPIPQASWAVMVMEEADSCVVETTH